MNISAQIFTLIMLGTMSGFAQNSVVSSTSEPRERRLAFHVTEGKDTEKDPGYSLYKNGYNLVLEEQWEEARKAFAQLRDKFPKSDYCDDAAYWSAYAMKYFDAAKALKEYSQFMRDYPKSSYYDDAVADLADLEVRMELRGKAPPGGVSLPHVPKPPMAPAAEARAFGLSLGRSQYDLERHMKRLDRRMRMLPPRFERVHWGREFTWNSGEKDLDPDTRLKIEALYAISESDSDREAFATLRAVALDRGKHVALRSVALDALSEYRTFDVLPIYLEVARTDTSARLQEDAISFIGEVSKDKDRSVAALVDLYNSLPADRKEQRESIFYSVAEIGNDKAVDFLANIARTSKDYELRTEAVYFLGNIGSDRSRKALFDILREQ